MRRKASRVHAANESNPERPNRNWKYSQGTSTSPPRLDKPLWGARETARYIGPFANRPTAFRGRAVCISLRLRGCCSSGRLRSEGSLSRSDRLPPCRRCRDSSGLRPALWRTRSCPSLRPTRLPGCLHRGYPLCQRYQLVSSSASCLDFSNENGYLCRSQGLAMRRSEGDAPHEACAYGSGTVGGEGVEEVLAWPPSAGGAVFDPEHWTGKIRQTTSEVLPDHLGGQIP